ncbi:hypothetical protein M413DRAFT_11534 [Hebeloma cylindrosporum]|uniref:Uncharacterized protein n=1 Tax=Hebeloma cylindrosporum TaxID=76867 RepID=A0A0C2YI15_HEBCY|nr:hypothetical protein M413DRAFT_11534 [Hebeloma cylindrosporum h7]
MYPVENVVNAICTKPLAGTPSGPVCDGMMDAHPSNYIPLIDKPWPLPGCLFGRQPEKRDKIPSSLNVTLDDSIKSNTTAWVTNPNRHSLARGPHPSKMTIVQRRWPRLNDHMTQLFKNWETTFLFILIPSMIPTFPLEIKDLIIDEVAACADLKTLKSCQLVCHDFLSRTRHHLFASITLNRVQFKTVEERLVFLKDIMEGIVGFPGMMSYIRKFTIDAKTYWCKHAAHKTSTEGFFSGLGICLILRLLTAQANSGTGRFQHISLHLNHGFEWTSFNWNFIHAFSSLSRASNVRGMTLEGLLGIPPIFIRGAQHLQKLFLLQSFMREEDGVINSVLPVGWAESPPPLDLLHVHEQFPAYILRARPGSRAPKMNLADLSISIRTPAGFSTIENIANLGPKVIGDVERLMLRFNAAKPPALPTSPFNWWSLFPMLQTIGIHYRNTAISSTNDTLVENARAILVPPTITRSATCVATTSINFVSFEFDLKTKELFGESVSQSVIAASRWKKWSWLDDVLSHPFYSTMTSLRILIRVFPSPSTDAAKINMKEFMTGLVGVFRVVLPLLSVKGKVEIQGCVFPVSA